MNIKNCQKVTKNTPFAYFFRTFYGISSLHNIVILRVFIVCMHIVNTQNRQKVTKNPQFDLFSNPYFVTYLTKCPKSYEKPPKWAFFRTFT